MGLGNLFLHLHQERQHREAARTTHGVAADARATQAEVEELRDAVDRLALLNQALWELVRDTTTLTDAALVARVEAIDRRDGVVDGRMGAIAQTCPTCQRPNAARRVRCLYCGSELSAPVPSNPP